MKRIRWPGLIAFVVLVALLVGGWVLFADTLVRRAVEAAGTRVVGARVELRAADAGFSPARIELQGLAVTDPDAPMRNAVEVERIAFDVDWVGLLLDRVHIDEVAVEGLRFGTPRETSGAIARTPRTRERSRLVEAAAERLQLPPLEVPSAATVLEREQLESPARIEAARQRLAEQRGRLDQRLAELPGDDALQGYRAELKKIESGGGSTSERLRRLKRLRDLVDSMEGDIDKLRAARREARDTLGAARDTAAEARKAPPADIERLYRKYTDPSAVAGELAFYLLGPRVAGWVNQGWYWYQRAAPYLGGGGGGAEPETRPARGAGRVVSYPGAAARPDILIQRVRISGGAQGDPLSGSVTDIAIPASRWGEPLRAELAGSGVAGIDRLDFEATVDRRTAGQSIARLDLDASGVDVTGMALGPGGALSAERGQAGFRASGSVINEALDLDLSVAMRNATFTAAQDAQPIFAEVGRALGGAAQLDVGAEVTGTTDSPEMSLTSSLKGVLAPLLRERLQAAAGDFRAGLREAVRERTADRVEALEAEVAELEQLEARFEQRLADFRDTLKRARDELD